MQSLNTDALDALRSGILNGCRAAELEITLHLVMELSEPGEVRFNAHGRLTSFIVAPPGQPSTNWDNELIDGISSRLDESPNQVIVTIISAGVSLYQAPGKVIAADAEYGSWWDGWAYDSSSGRWGKVCVAHEVAPRPHMAPAMEYARENAIGFILARAKVG